MSHYCPLGDPRTRKLRLVHVIYRDVIARSDVAESLTEAITIETNTRRNVRVSVIITDVIPFLMTSKATS